MGLHFYPARYFYTSTGWYVYMREGDEKYQAHHYNNRIKSYPREGITVAGPFGCRRALKNWLEGFISFYGESRKKPLKYIPDEVVIPDRNSIDI